MSELYEQIEAAFLWATVILVLGFVTYLAYRQYLKLRYRRARRRHHARRALRRQRSLPEQDQRGHAAGGAVHQPTQS